VIHNGTIIQEGSVNEVFNNPSNRFVARYAGVRNFFRVKMLHENGLLTGVTANNVKFSLNGGSPGNDSLLIIKSDSIVLSDEVPLDKDLNAIKGKIDEIIPSEFGLEVTINAGDLFYVNIPAAAMGKLSLIEEREIWMSFPRESVIILNGVS